MKTKRYIGISGVARSGKNLFCDISKKVLFEEYGYKCNSYALAYYLKEDCESFVRTRLGLDVFTENTEDKKSFIVKSIKQMEDAASVYYYKNEDVNAEAD